jgi:hypothetical protein
MAKPNRAPRDPRGHHARIYSEVYDSPAFSALSPIDVVAYLALLRDLKAYNNGDLALTLPRAKERGIKHHNTLASALRALCAVGLIAVTRKGGCTKGGQRLPNLYRVTDVDCYAVPAKGLEAIAATNEWRKVESIEQGQRLIESAEAAAKQSAKLKSLGHAVTTTTLANSVVRAKTTLSRSRWNDRPRYPVAGGKIGENPATMRASGLFCPVGEITNHRTSAMPPIHIATPTAERGHIDAAGRYVRLTVNPAHLSAISMH